jgi:hypothetical protein
MAWLLAGAPGRTGAAIVLALGLLAGAPAPRATASCATTPSIDEAVLLGEVVFVGTVSRIENGGRWATVKVEERWQGARSLGDTVEVHGGPEPGTATSIDRTYSTTRYLFVVRNGPGYLEDDQCTATTSWVPDLARLRPIDVSPAADVAANTTSSGLDLEPYLPLFALVGALVIAVVAYVFILRARARPPDWMR